MREYQIIITALCAQIVTLESTMRELQEKTPLNIKVTDELAEIAEQYGNYCFRCGKTEGAYYNFLEWKRRVKAGEEL